MPLFGTITEREKNPESSLVTSQLEVLTKDLENENNMRRYSVSWAYDAYSKWHMPIFEKICRAEQKYMPLFGTVTERVFRENIQSTETYTNRYNAALCFFFRKTR